MDVYRLAIHNESEWFRAKTASLLELCLLDWSKYLLHDIINHCDHPTVAKAVTEKWRNDCDARKCQIHPQTPQTPKSSVACLGLA